MIFKPKVGYTKGDAFLAVDRLEWLSSRMRMFIQRLSTNLIIRQSRNQTGSRMHKVMNRKSALCNHAGDRVVIQGLGWKRSFRETTWISIVMKRFRKS